MRHRIVTNTGLGNPDPVLLDNKGTFVWNDLANDAIDKYFQRYEGFDYQLNKHFIAIGYEPAYEGETLKIICIHKDINKSYIKTGKACGAYGSGITATTKYYGDYKYKSKFVKFIDRWHKELFGEH